MAEKQESSLIGYDPLAWMDEGPGKNETELPQSQPEQENSLDVDSATATDWVESKEQNSNSETENHGLVLESVQNIQNVAELHSKLILSIEQSDKIEIDASNVKSIDTATIQLLIVLKKTAIKTHKEVVFDFPSEKFIEAADLLGLSEMLGVENAEAGFF